MYGVRRVYVVKMFLIFTEWVMHGVRFVHMVTLCVGTGIVEHAGYVSQFA